MALDTAKNFARGTLSTTYLAAATTIVVTTGHGARYPAVPFNATWWDSSVYADPSNDPNVEIVRVTNITSDTLTVTRAQEGTSASDKNTGGSTYSLAAGLTAKVLNIDLPAEYVRGAANLGTATAIPVVSAAGVVTSDQSLINFDLVNCRLGIGMTTPTNEIQIQRTKSGGSTIVAIQNLSNTATSNAFFACYTAGTSGGGAFIKCSILSVESWCAGIQSTDSKYRIAHFGDVSGTNAVVTLTTGDRMGIVEQSPGSTLSVKGNMTVGNDTAYSQAAAPTNGMLVKGNVAIGLTSASAALDVGGTSMAWCNAIRRTYANNYSCAVGAFVAINLNDSSALLAVPFVYKVTLNTASTGTVTGAVYIVTFSTGSVWTVKNVSNNGLTSNHPQLRVNVAGTGLEVFHLHPTTTYTISTIVETYAAAGNITTVAPTFLGLEGGLCNSAGNILIGSTTDDATNALQVTGSIKATTNIKIGTSTAGTLYLGTDLAMSISRSTTTLTIAGATSTSIAGTVFIGSDLVLSTNNTSYYGKDTAGTSILMLRCASDNTVRVGPQIATATNGHLLMYSAATERARFVPTGELNIGAGQTPTALLSINTQAVFATVTAHSTAFLINGGTVGTTATNEVVMASIGAKAGTNAVCLGIRLYRVANGTDWTTTALGIGMDVDATVRAGASMFFHNDKKISMGTQITTGNYTLKIAGAIADSPGITLAATNSSGGVQSGTLSFLGSSGKDWRQFIGTSAEFIIRDSNNGRNLIRLDTGGTIELGNNHTGTGYTVTICDATASTGATQLQVRGGPGQSTTPLFSIHANDGTTLLAQVSSAGVLIADNIKRGTGSPETVVTGVVGDLYMRTDGGANTTLYVKESGSGNTGWIAK